MSGFVAPSLENYNKSCSIFRERFCVYIVWKKSFFLFKKGKTLNYYWNKQLKKNKTTMHNMTNIIIKKSPALQKCWVLFCFGFWNPLLTETATHCSNYTHYSVKEWMDGQKIHKGLLLLLLLLACLLNFFSFLILFCCEMKTLPVIVQTCGKVAVIG